MSAARTEGLTIERHINRFRTHAPLDASRCARWFDAFAAVDGAALAAKFVAPEEWLLIRDLSLRLRWPEDAAEADVLACWQEALQAALNEATAGPVRANAAHDESRASHSAVVRYAHRRVALADLLYRSAQGDTTRQWAWHRMSLIGAEGLSAVEALGQGLRVLLAEPELIWPVIERLIAGEEETAALSATLRVVPAADWLRLLRASPRSRAYVEALDHPESAIALVAGAVAASDFEPNAAAVALLGWAAARAPFVASHADVVGILIAAIAAPAIGITAGESRQRLRVVRLALQQALSVNAAAPAAGPCVVVDIPNRTSDLPPLPDLPTVAEALEWQATDWAGALFWLTLVPATGLLEWRRDVAASPEQAPSLLRRLGLALGIPADDPALRAFCGGESVPQETSAAAGLDACIAACIGAWSEWLDAEAPDLEPPRLTTVCRRSGRLRFEPGWIELHMPLASVDTGIRRLGLDLDPGWMPWLGCVLRIVYED